MGQFWTKVFRHRDVRILLLGLDGAGKTTLLYRLKLGEIITHIPTIGFNVEQLQYKNISFTAWDIGARDKMRPLFRHYYKGTDAVVIVVDASDRERLDELYCDVLKPALNAEELAHSIFLFLVNKKDLPETMDKEEVEAKLNLKSLKHTWHIVETSAVRGDGLTESLDWLAAQLGSSQPRKSQNPMVAIGTERPKPLHGRLSGSSDKIHQKDYCNRAYSAFRCFFIRPSSVPPEIQD